MGQHVHDESESASGGDHLHRWDATRMARHLKDVHGFVAPMSWDVGRMHLHHLEDHQGPGPVQQAEEAFMSTEHEHDDLTTVHAAWSHTMLAQHLRDEHGGDVPAVNANDHDGLKTWHLRAHGALVSTEPEQPKPEPESPRVTVDRVICALAGIDFDSEWVPDNGLGSRARGHFRDVYGRQANQLLVWLDRGGVARLPATAHLVASEDRAYARVREIEAELEQARTQVAEFQLMREDRDQLLKRAGELSRQLEEQAAALRGEFERAEEALRQQRDEARQEVTAACRLQLEAQEELAELKLRAEGLETELENERGIVHDLEAVNNGVRRQRDELAQQHARQQATIQFLMTPEHKHTLDGVADQHAALALQAAARAFRKEPTLLYTRDAAANWLDRLAEASLARPLGHEVDDRG